MYRHNITELQDKTGELLGATILLSPEEVKQLRNGNSVTIRRKSKQD